MSLEGNKDNPNKYSVFLLLLIFFLLLLDIQPTMGCSKSAMYYRPRRLSRSHVFVLEEYQPSQWEKNVDASGPLVKDDFIERQDDNRLVKVEHGQNILFETENARYMTKGNRDRLHALAAFVQNQWPNKGVYLQVVRAWGPPPALSAGYGFPGTNRASPQFMTGSQNYVTRQQKTMDEFHYAGRAVDIRLLSERYREPDMHSGKLAELALYMAKFDWCIYTRFGHVHCSVKPDSIIVSSWYGCFHGSSTVLKDGSPTALQDVKVGDRVLAITSSGKPVYSEVILFLHHSPETLARFITMTTESNHTLLVTPNHLVYRVPNTTKDHTTQSDHFRGVRQAVFASDIAQGDQVLVYDSRSQSFMIERVTRLRNTAEFHMGVYAPLTAEGTVVVDNIAASSFAHVRSERLARTFLAPYLLYQKVVSYMCPYSVGSFSDIHTNHSTGVHWYADLLWTIGRFVLPSDLLYPT